MVDSIHHENFHHHYSREKIYVGYALDSRHRNHLKLTSPAKAKSEKKIPSKVIPFGFTTSSALVSASLHHKPMVVLCLPSRPRSCVSRLAPNWQLQWKVASCVLQ